MQGAGAALDLVEQAGAGAVVVIAVRAGAQQKGALERVHGAEHRAGAGERPEIIAGNRARAAMLDEPRRVVAAGDQNVGEALVVAQHHVVARLQLLDQIGLEQQRLGFGLGGDEHHRAGLRHHAGDARRLTLGRRIGGDALFDRARLADIKHLALGADHPVDARPERRVPPEVADRLGAARKTQGLGRRLVEREVERSRIGAEFALERRLGPGLGFGRLARGIAFRRAGHPRLSRAGRKPWEERRRRR